MKTSSVLMTTASFVVLSTTTFVPANATTMTWIPSCAGIFQATCDNDLPKQSLTFASSDPPTTDIAGGVGTFALDLSQPGSVTLILRAAPQGFHMVHHGKSGVTFKMNVGPPGGGGCGNAQTFDESDMDFAYVSPSNSNIRLMASLVEGATTTVTKAYFDACSISMILALDMSFSDKTDWTELSVTMDLPTGVTSGLFEYTYQEDQTFFYSSEGTFSLKSPATPSPTVSPTAAPTPTPTSSSDKQQQHWCSMAFVLLTSSLGAAFTLL